MERKKQSLLLQTTKLGSHMTVTWTAQCKLCETACHVGRIHMAFSRAHARVDRPLLWTQLKHVGKTRGRTTERANTLPSQVSCIRWPVYIRNGEGISVWIVANETDAGMMDTMCETYETPEDEVDKDYYENGECLHSMLSFSLLHSQSLPQPQQP